MDRCLLRIDHAEGDNDPGFKLMHQVSTAPRKVHFLVWDGRAACNQRAPALTTRVRAQVTCGICGSVGVRAPTLAVAPRTPGAYPMKALLEEPLPTDQYRFVCEDSNGTRQTMRYAPLPDDDLARTHGQHMLCEFPSVLIYYNDRLVARAMRSIQGQAH